MHTYLRWESERWRVKKVLGLIVDTFYIDWIVTRNWSPTAWSHLNSHLAQTTVLSIGKGRGAECRCVKVWLLRPAISTECCEFLSGTNHTSVCWETDRCRVQRCQVLDVYTRNINGFFVRDWYPKHWYRENSCLEQNTLLYIGKEREVQITEESRDGCWELLYFDLTLARFSHTLVLCKLSSGTNHSSVHWETERYRGVKGLLFRLSIYKDSSCEQSPIPWSCPNFRLAQSLLMSVGKQIVTGFR